MIEVGILDPVNGTEFIGPANIVLTAVVTSTNPVSYVQFFFGTNSIGQVLPTVSGYGPIIAGTVALTNGSPTVAGTGTSFTTDFSVGDYISFISQPGVYYQIFNIPSNISLTLGTPFTGANTAADFARSVTLYGYYNFAWNSVEVGNYSLTAKVVDVLGNTATSTAVQISVKALAGNKLSSVSGSSIGFGHNPFGNHEFGVGDWAEEMLWKNIPEFYRVADEGGPPNSLVDHPLRKFVTALKPFFQDLRDKWGKFTTLWDADRVPLSNLPQLAYNVGIAIDPTKPEGLQRSSTLNAAQLWVNKGTDKGYQITAAFEGLLVTITPLWSETCAAADQVLGVIGTDPAAFDLSTTDISPHPVPPGTLDIKVTTALNLAQSITDDANGNLIGHGTQPNGPLTKILVTQARTLQMSSITGGAINPGDTLTQGLTTGIVIDTIGFTIKVKVTAGAFTPGAVSDPTSGASGVIATVAIDSLTIGETVLGTSGTTAVVEDNETIYLLIDTITTNSGFSVNEVLVGQSSGQYALAGVSTPLLQGPLRTQISFSAGVGSYTTGELVTGGTSGATGIVRVGGAGNIFVDTITQPGFSNGEALTGAISATSKTIGSQALGTINYLTGEMTGQTWLLAPGSEVSSVADFTTEGPTEFIPQFDSVPADLLPLDYVQTERYALWPRYTIPVRTTSGILTAGPCRSYSLRLFFFKPDDTEIEDFIDVATRISTSLENFRPIHVRFDKIAFDGARASSQVWRTGRIVADSFAVNTWTVNVAANQQASSQVWTIPAATATVAT